MCEHSLFKLPEHIQNFNVDNKKEISSSIFFLKWDKDHGVTWDDSPCTRASKSAIMKPLRRCTREGKPLYTGDYREKTSIARGFPVTNRGSRSITSIQLWILSHVEIVYPSVIHIFYKISSEQKKSHQKHVIFSSTNTGTLRSFVTVCNNLFLYFGGYESFVGHWYPCFRLLVTYFLSTIQS